jgi:ferrous iron transport protein B
LSPTIFPCATGAGDADSGRFYLELPPYRRPRIWQTIYTSLIDCTLIVLWRAVVFAAPAGLVIWSLANIQLDGASMAEYLVDILDPFAVLLGLNGIVLLAYIVAMPANEIVIPTVLMLTVLIGRATGVGTGAGVLFEGDAASVETVLRAGGWMLLTAINLMLFNLLHNPCSTALYTIYKEMGSGKWTLLAVLLPLGMGLLTVFAMTQIWQLAVGGG